jgi:hypothetical protein
MMQALDYIVISMCSGIIVSCVCRVNFLNVRRGDKYGWLFMYIAFAAGSGSLAMDVLTRHVTTGELFVVLGIGLNLLLTKSRWKYGAPPIVKRGEK